MEEIPLEDGNVEEVVVDHGIANFGNLVYFDSAIELPREQQSSAEAVSLNERTQRLIDNLSWKYFSTRAQLERSREMNNMLRNADRSARVAKVSMFEQFQEEGSAPPLEDYIASRARNRTPREENGVSEEAGISDNNENIQRRESTAHPIQRSTGNSYGTLRNKLIVAEKQISFLEVAKEALLHELERERELNNYLRSEHEQVLTSLGSFILRIRQENRLLETDYDEMDRMNLEQEVECGHMIQIVKDLEARNKRLEEALLNTMKRGGMSQFQAVQSRNFLIEKVNNGIRLAEELKNMGDKLKEL